MVLETVIIIEDQEKLRLETESLKMALISADPAHFLGIFFPAFATPVITQTIDDALGTSTPFDEATPEIEFDLTPPPTAAEKAAIVESLLADKTGTLQFGESIR